MSCLAEVDFLSLISLGDERSDVNFKFEGRTKEINGHKLLLSLISPVFHEQFFGTLSSNARAESKFSGEVEVIEETEFSHAAFNIFMRHIYGDKGIIKSCSDFELLFELVQICQHYLVKSLESIVQAHIRELVVNLGHILSCLEVAQSYQHLDGFETLCNEVYSQIVFTFSRLSRQHQTLFCTENREANLESVIALEELMARSLPEEQAVKCQNCRRPLDECKHGQLVNELPHVGMKYRNATGVREVTFVSATHKKTSAGEPVYDVRVRRARDGRITSKLYPTNYRDYYRYHCES